MRHSPARAFTLIELLVVISIVALLISITLPSLAQARDKASNLKCLASSRGVMNAVLTYAADNREAIVRSAFDPVRTSYAGILKNGDYINEDVFSNRGCPYGPTKANTNLDAFGDDYYSAGDDPYRSTISYGLNGILQSAFGFDTPTYDYGKTQFTFRSQRMIYSPSTAGVIVCNVTPWSHLTQHVTPSLHHTLGDPSYGYIPASFMKPRHKGEGLPMAMADGHSVIVSSGELFSGYSILGPKDSYMAAFSIRNYFGAEYLFP